jgi:AmpD protein
MALIDPHFFITPEGWCKDIARSPCENFDARPEQTVIDLLVIHNISLPPEEYGGSYIEDLFANQLDCDAHPYFEKLRDLKVSAHFLIKRDGGAHQFVATQDRAWHAGASEFKGRARCNDFSIGIELEGSDFESFTDRQYQVLAKLTAALVVGHALTDVRGHQHIAPGRKTDPGPFFDWQRYQGEFNNLIENDISFMKLPTKLTFPD